MSAGEQLDRMAAAMARGDAPLDDVTRARIGVRIDAAIRGEVAPAPSRRWIAVPAIAALAAAAAVVVWIAGRGGVAVGGGELPEVAMPAPPPHVDEPAPAPEPTRVDDMNVTFYGPGRVVRKDAGVVIEGDAFVVDRDVTTGSTATVTVGDMEIRIQRATFAVDLGTRARVTVMRGEVVLVCSEHEETIAAGSAGSCEPPAPTPAPVRTAVREEPPPREAPVPPPAFTAEDRYHLAEQAMARGDDAAAIDELEALVAIDADAAASAPALLDLARLAQRRGDRAAALDALDRLASHPHGAPLAEPAAHLRCKLVDDRLACLAELRRAFPSSKRDAAVLAELATGRAAAGDCDAARPLLDEYLGRYADGRDAAAVREWRAHCDEAGLH